jgi:hypothetical protein
VDSQVRDALTKCRVRAQSARVLQPKRQTLELWSSGSKPGLRGKGRILMPRGGRYIAKDRRFRGIKRFSGVRGAYGWPAISIDHHFFRTGVLRPMPERSSPAPRQDQIVSASLGHSRVSFGFNRTCAGAARGIKRHSESDATQSGPRRLRRRPKRSHLMPDPRDRSDACRPGRGYCICCLGHLPIDAMGRQRNRLVEDGDAACATCPALADKVLLAIRRLKSMPRSAPLAVSRAPPGQNWRARNPLLQPVGQQMAKSRSPVDLDGSF